MTEKFFRILDVSKGFLVLLVFLVSIPFFGGNDTRAIFLGRLFILAAAFLCLVQQVMVRTHYSEEVWHALRNPLIGFSLFIAYGLWQAFAGAPGFLRGAVGSAYAHETGEQVLQLFFYVLFFLLCVDIFSSLRRVRWALFLIAAEVTVLVVWVYHLKTSHLILSSHQSPSPWLFFVSNSNYFGAILIMVTPFFLGTIAHHSESIAPGNHLDTEDAERFFCLALTALLTAAIFHAEARAVFVAQVFFILFFIFFGMEAGKREKGLMLLILFVCVIFMLYVVETTDLAKKDYRTFMEAFQRRAQISRESLAAFFDRPFFGTGLGTFVWVNRNYQIQAVETIFYKNCYNSYLGLLIETGVVGFGLFVGSLGILFFGLVKRLKAIDPGWIKSMAMASGMALVVLIFLSWGDIYLKTPAVVFLAILHTSFLLRSSFLHRQMVDQTRFRERKKKFELQFNFALGIAGISILASLIFMSYNGFKAKRLLESNGSLTQQGLNQAGRRLSLPMLEKSVRLTPGNAEAWALLGRAYRQAGEFEKSVKALQRSTELLPVWPDSWLHLGVALGRSGKQEQGLEALAKGVSLIPHNRDAYLFLINQYLLAADRAVSESDRHRRTQQAKAWIQQAKKLPRPFTVEDYDYIADYDHANGSPRKLKQAEKDRLLPILTQTLESEVA